MKLIEIVIPTVWKSVHIHTMLPRYINNPYVKKIHLIDNGKDAENQLKVNSYKLNIYKPHRYNGYWVNPAWNLGVEKCEEDSIVCLIGDDILFDDSIFQYISQHENEIQLMGMQKENLKHFTPDIKYNPDIISVENRDWGWGIFIVTHKKYWKPIPKELKVYYGDDWLIRYLGVQPQMLTGLPIDGQMSASADVKGVSERFIKDGDIWYKKYNGK